MLSTVLLNTLALLPQGGGSGAPVVINEFCYDDSSTDTLEFVELYNRSSAPVDLGGWSLVGDDSNGVNFTETFAAGTILNPGEFFVLGDANVPNVNLVRASGFLENSNESITLYDAASVMVDTLIYEANKGVFNAALAEGEGIWGNCTTIEQNETTWSRIRDGWDTDNNGNDFRLQPWSPGASNNLPRAAATVELFDGLTTGTDVPGWGSSYVNPLVIDPTVIDGNNPVAMPPSPQGGNVMVAWDPLGGGNHTMLATDPGQNVRCEMYVYVEAAPAPAAELEMWSIGFGTSGTFYNFPDPTGTLGFTANGDTGICFTYVRDDLGATIYLMDRNDGGLGGNALTPPVTVGSEPITAGVNDGWQRILIEINNGNVEARFGGTFGASDGTLFTTTTDTVDRGLYVSYREGVTNLFDARPVAIDFLTVETTGSATVTPYGVGCDGLTLTANDVPALGNATFELQVNNVTLGTVGFVGFGSSVVNPGLDLTSIGMAGCFGYTSLDIGLFGTTTFNSGTAGFVLPVPNTTALINGALSAQGVALSVATALQLASTNGLVLTFGL